VDFDTGKEKKGKRGGGFKKVLEWLRKLGGKKPGCPGSVLISRGEGGSLKKKKMGVCRGEKKEKRLGVKKYRNKKK